MSHLNNCVSVNRDKSVPCAGSIESNNVPMILYYYLQDYFSLINLLYLTHDLQTLHLISCLAFDDPINLNSNIQDSYEYFLATMILGVLLYI